MSIIPLAFFGVSEYYDPMLKSDEKKKIATEHGLHGEDSGSVEVQVAILTRRINQLTEHLKSNRKDNLSRLGLLKMVGKRKRLLDYLAKNKKSGYEEILKKLDLRK